MGHPMRTLAELVHEKFKTSKFRLAGNQWTVVAGIGMKRHADDEFKLVALGSGLKCLPLKEYDQANLNISLVHDSHGEVLARRAFIRYLLDQIRRMDELGDDCIFTRNGDRWALKDEITFHMYVSHAPCGDASMEELMKQSQEEDAVHTASKRAKYGEEDSFRRGRDDFSANVGMLRTKPGRADAPFSSCMSCSDKITSWTALGIQGGALMNILEEPIYLSSITVGDAFNLISLDRALNARIPADLFEKETDLNFKVKRLAIQASTLPFGFNKEKGKVSASEAFLWFEGCSKPETLVKGRKKGSGPPKNNFLPLISQSCTSKQSIFAELQAILPDRFKSYREAKSSSVEYNKAKDKILALPNFKGWLRGPTV